jgi:transposase
MNQKEKKQLQLKQNSCLNLHPEHVTDTLFQTEEFFDPNDMIQVKYEMLRKVRSDESSVTKAAQEFGFSRVSFYKIKEAFQKYGLEGLIPKKRGPKKRHKVTEEVVAYCQQQLAEEKSLTFPQLAEIVLDKFDLSVHPRSIRRALETKKKNNPTKVEFEQETEPGVGSPL